MKFSLSKRLMPVKPHENWAKKKAFCPVYPAGPRYGPPWNLPNGPKTKTKILLSCCQTGERGI